jgi:hypothetical protein
MNNNIKECINLNDYIKDDEIMQIQINDDELIIKKIGKSKINNDIIICENIGKNKNISLYSIMYSNEELKYYNEISNLFNIIKLHEKNENENILFNLSVKIKEEIEINKIIKNFDIYFILSVDDKKKEYFKKYDKKINKNNIVETIISEYLLVKK